MIYCIGIDNGFKGAVAILNSDKQLTLIEMPYVVEKIGKTERRRYDVPAMLNVLYSYVHMSDLPDDKKDKSILNDDDRVMVFVEKAHPMPRSAGGSPQGNFQTGFGFGLWTGLCSALRLEYQEIPAKTWQNHFMPNIKGRKELKAESVRLAESLFPAAKESFRGPRGGAKDGYSDASLIALFGMKSLTT